MVPMAARILILDDDPALVDAIADLLRESGYEAQTKVQRVFQDVVDANPDLVFIDAAPGIEGKTLNFGQRMRLNRATARIPVIVSTTNLRYVEPAIVREQRIHVLIKP